MFNKFKKKWKKFLDTIADQNKATYGEGGINCCELKDVTENKGTQSKWENYITNLINQNFGTQLGNQESDVL